MNYGDFSPPGILSVQSPCASQVFELQESSFQSPLPRKRCLYLDLTVYIICLYINVCIVIFIYIAALRLSEPRRLQVARRLQAPLPLGFVSLDVACSPFQLMRFRRPGRRHAYGQCRCLSSTTCHSVPKAAASAASAAVSAAGSAAAVVGAAASTAAGAALSVKAGEKCCQLVECRTGPPRPS